MKGSLTKVVIFLLMAVVCVSALNAQGVVPRRITVKSLIPSGMPVSVEFAAVTDLGGDLVVTYSLTNKSKHSISAVDISLVVYDVEGNARGGEGWRQRVDLAKGVGIDLSRMMKTKVMPGDRVVFSVYQAGGQAGSWGIDLLKVVDAAKAYIAGDRYRLPEARFIRGQ